MASTNQPWCPDCYQRYFVPLTFGSTWPDCEAEVGLYEDQDSRHSPCLRHDYRSLLQSHVLPSLRRHPKSMAKERIEKGDVE